ncbi:MAG: nickel pincer cofactor biosynthesis protein LarB [Cyanobacteriota bacterium]|nr:nickel pincer cofactor biosynthesis protein LarB [Cyanobacteriota bacterium]
MSAAQPPPADDRRLGIELDLERRRRLGMVEAVWGEHKSAEQIALIVRRLAAAGEVTLVTRVDGAKAAAVAELLGWPLHDADDATDDAFDDVALEAGLRYHRLARGLCCGPRPAPQPRLGRVAVVAAGSSDLAVAAEAELALACHGVAVERVVDVGVAGLQRLLGRLEQLRQARVLIACAGMEGSLPTVMAGLLAQPVIAVPVAVGYGVSAGGLAALHSMLASCAPGLTVVNIDNGYGAAMAALRILGLTGAADSDRR